MDSKERRRKILEILNSKKEPVKGQALANQMDVSRQVIVSDIAILRAKGNKILATPHGYLKADNITKRKSRSTIACKHHMDDIKKELDIVVNYGGEIIDVTVEHPIYGELNGMLHIKSQHDVDEFIGKLENTRAKPLLSLTGGVHLHTIEAENEEKLELIKEKLRKAGILFEEN